MDKIRLITALLELTKAVSSIRDILSPDCLNGEKRDSLDEVNKSISITIEKLSEALDANE